MSVFSKELRMLCRLLSQTRGMPGPAIDTYQRVNWERVKDLIEYNQLGAYLATRLTSSQMGKMPQDLQLELQGIYSMEAREAMVRTPSIRRMFDLLEGKVEAVALKGAALTWTLYRDAAERPMSDADFLLRPGQDLERAENILRNAGFNMGDGLQEHHHLAPLQDAARSLAVELHSNFTTPPLRKEIMDWLWHRVVSVEIKGGKHITILDPIGQLFHHCIHALNDPVDSPLVRNLFEIAVMINQMSSGMQKDFTNQMKAWKMERHVSRAIYLAHRLFGSPAICGKPAFGTLDYWCVRCLHRYHDLPPGQRMEAHVARQHIESLHRGAGNRNPLPLILLLGDLTWGHIDHAARAGKKRFFAHPKRPDFPSRKIGDSLIVHNTYTGEVQLLNQRAATVWQAADGTRTEQDFIADLMNENDLASDDVKVTLHTLYQSHLIGR